MRTLAATVEIRADGSIELRLDGELEPGEHHGLLVLTGEGGDIAQSGDVLSLPPLPLGLDHSLRLSREEIYGDDSH